MSIPRALSVALFAATLAACADQPTEPPAQPKPRPAPLPLGVYEVVITGADGTGDGGPSASRAVAVPTTPSEALNPVTPAASLSFESVSTSTFTEGTRTTGGQRFVIATFRVRNMTGAPLSNVTLIPAIRTTTKPGSPFSTLLRFDGAAVPDSVAKKLVPTGAVTMGEDLRLRSLLPDAIQVFDESEVAAIGPLPPGTTSLFPYGFVVRNPNSAVDRTLPNASGPNDWGGLVTFAFRYPLQPAASGDPFTIGLQFMAVQDTEMRMTESIEERQDSAGVRRARERALALGVDSVRVLAGSPAADPFVTDYPGQRQICSVRTSGPPGAPTGFMNDGGAYTELVIYRPGQGLASCDAYYTSGSPSPAYYRMEYQVTLRAMDRYGNIRTAAVDTVTLTSTDGTATMPSTAALVAGVRTRSTNYSTYGNSTLIATGRRLRGTTPVFVNGMTRTWDGDIDTNWLTNGDWVQNMHPGMQDSVIIPGDRPNYPLLVANTSTYGLTMTPGASVQPFINLSSFDLTVAGDVNLGSTGTFTGTGRLILTGNSNTVGGGITNFNVRNMRVTGRYSASSNLNVTGGRIVVQGGRLRSQGFRVRVRPS